MSLLRARRPNKYGGNMKDKNKKNIWWPDVSTPTAARSARMYGIWAALFSAVVTALLASWSLGSGKLALELVDAWAFIDVVIFTAIAFGIHKESRFAAVSGLVILLGEKLYQISIASTTSGVVMAFILGMCYVASIRGTYALHRFRATQPVV